MTDTDINALVERLEQATGPDRELDAAIWLATTPGVTRKSSGYTHKATGRWCEIDETRDATGRLIIVPSYTGSLDAAMTLVPEGVSRVGFDYWEPDEDEKDRRANFAHVARGAVYYCSRAHTSPIALCIAALRARAALEREDGTK